MPPTPQELQTLREEVYILRTAVTGLRAQFHQEQDLAALDRRAAELAQQEQALSAKARQLQAAEAQDPKSGLIVNTKQDSLLLGALTTGLEVQVHLRMAYVPTGICHLLSPSENPLVSCTVTNTDNTRRRRLRVVSFIEGYTAKAVDTVELDKTDPNNKHSFDQLPVLFPNRVRRLTELTRASLNVQVKDLDGRVELHRTYPIWLLARNTAPLEVKDPKSARLIDMTPYLGAFVTPHEPSIMDFGFKVVQHHPNHTLSGYQDLVKPQARAIFDALKQDAGIAYVSSIISFDPSEGAQSQRIRLPRESLRQQQANCIDGTLLFASLLEYFTLNPAIVVVPGHAMVAWEDPPSTAAQPGRWNCLETTHIPTHSFEEACDHGDRRARVYRTLLDSTGDPRQFRLWSLRELRTARGITPLE